MAQLNSPGVSVTVIDESFYTPAAPGTVPLIVVASQANKMNSSGTGIAPGTLEANAGKVYLLTSQQDLGSTFGIPYFQTDAENNPINASEINEYGLQAAYSFLGVSNRAYVVRADLDTSQLIGETNAPSAPPSDGTYWFDVTDTQFGIFQWNSSPATTTGGQLFVNQQSVNNFSYVTNVSLIDTAGAYGPQYAPLPSYGALGDYAITGDTSGTTTLIKLWLKKYQTSTAAGTWVEVGTANWVASWPTLTAGAAPSSLTAGATFIINGITITVPVAPNNTIANLVTQITTAVSSNPVVLGGVTAAVVNGYLNIYSNGTSVYNSLQNGSLTISGTALASLGFTAGSYLCPQLTMSPHYSVPLYGTFDQTGNGYTNGAPTGSIWVKTTPVNLGASYFIKKYNAATSTWIQQPVQLFANNQSALATLDPTGGGINLPIGTSYVKYGDNEAVVPSANGSEANVPARFKLYTRTGVGATKVTSNPFTNGTFDTNPLTAVGQGYIGGATASATGIISAGDGVTAGTVLSVTGTVTGTFATGMHITGTGTTASTISAINSASLTGTVGPTLSSITITSNTGVFGCSTAGITLVTGMPVTISGTLGGTGSISGYAGGPTTYYIIGSPTQTSFQLSATKGGSAITTTTGTPSGLTFTLAVLSVSGVSSGTISAGMVITGSGITAGTYINALGTGSGGNGTYFLNQGTTGTPTTGTSYTVSASQSVASTTITGIAAGNTLNITGSTSGTYTVGMVLSGIGTSGITITAVLSGSGGVGTYTIGGSASYVASTTITGTASSETYSFTVVASQVGSASLPTTAPLLATVTFGAVGNALTDAQAFLQAFSSAVTDPNLSATLGGTTLAPTITITHLAGGDIKFVDGANLPLGSIFSTSTTANWYNCANGVTNNYIATLWSPTVSGSAFAPAAITAPTSNPADGTLWYNTDITDVDIMVNNGTSWVGYLNYTQNAVGGSTTDPKGPIVSDLAPTTQASGAALANGDIWISTADLENFPLVYKYNFLTKSWVLVNNTDHTSSNGIIFADARWGIEPNTQPAPTSGTVAESTIPALLSSNFVDFDAPNPALYPKGMLLWNLRRSGFNVKQYVTNYVNQQAYNTMYQNTLMSYYSPDRWVSAAPNNLDGSGAFGRHAQRGVVLKALLATIESNTNIRQPDTVIFNLLSCPGYLEVTSALVNLNTDNGQTAFIVADAPARLTPDATSLSNWGNNTAQAAEDGDTGLIVTDPYTAVYYPWGYTADLLGNNIVVPPSHIMLRTIALSDNVSYPWFAPAGVRRGGVTNVSSVGYVDTATGEFITVALNTGQRDTLAAIHVNPITYIAGTGLVAYGQYTRQLVASAMDRINVARLVIYMRYQLNAIAKPFIFEPNDTITRNEIKQQIEKLLLELTAERALYDYLVVCDSSNNTPARIDASELYVDIAIEPVKAVEFIYIPLRLENTGAIKGLAGA